MTFMPFMFDRSPTAKLIKAIDARVRQSSHLEKLQRILTKDISNIPYGYLEQARRRAAQMLPLAKDEEEKELLQGIYMTAFRRIQRIHMESRP